MECYRNYEFVYGFLKCEYCCDIFYKDSTLISIVKNDGEYKNEILFEK